MEKKKIENLSAKLIANRQTGRVSFSDVEHRLQTILNHNDVEWINDSKSTNLESTCYSLEMLQKPIIWIVGTNERARDFSLIEKLVRLKVCKIVCYGKYDTAVKYSLSSVVDGYAYKNELSDAIDIANQWSKKGYAVLFSPACASYGAFKDYKHRGNEFIRIVNELL
jgi:UDP-N-acetylmuramoylalanine--D-glutamate ligase